MSNSIGKCKENGYEKVVGWPEYAIWEGGMVDVNMPEKQKKQNIEWKLKWKDEYLEWICAFAKAQGGEIYIGCDDGGNVAGVSNARKLIEDIPNQVREAMGIAVDVNLLEKDGLPYIEIDVPAYPVGISCKGIYYYRSGSTRQKLSGPAGYVPSSQAWSVVRQYAVSFVSDGGCR